MKLYQNNIFLTLTYDDQHLPKEGLDARALQNFLKRIRKHATTRSTHITKDHRHGIRYLACGEYGTQNERPHYHAILFNCGFTDRYKVGGTTDKGLLYASEALNQLWRNGDARFAEANTATANYIAKYTLKKTGRVSADRDGVDRPPEFLRMSLKPFIGKKWLEQYATDLQNGYLIVDGTKHSIPRTYIKELAKTTPTLADYVQRQKEKYRAQTDTVDREQRLADAEKIHTRLKELTECRIL